MKSQTVAKQLSANDVSKTGSHQAGILIPKRAEILGFFPALDPTLVNPRRTLVFSDKAGRKWTFAFIYYNNKLFGGTRNEYRLTGMTAFFSLNRAKAGEFVVFERSPDGMYTICLDRNQPVAELKSQSLRLGPSWRVVKI